MDFEKSSDLKSTGSLKADLYLMTNGKYFLGHHINYIREKLQQMDESKWPLIFSAELKDPSNIQLVSLFAGQLGIDRFMIGDTGMGVGKLLTCGGFGIWTIVDWFSIQEATKQKNMEKLQQFIG